MDTVNRIDKIIQDIESKPLSEIIPHILSLALTCKDYRGYCVFSFWISPIVDNPNANSIQRNEIFRTLFYQGISKEEVMKIANESSEEYLQMKTISADEISSHSAKEIESWLHNAKETLASVSNVPRENYSQLSERITQIERIYEVLRSYVVSKLVFYRQVISHAENVKLKNSKAETTKNNKDEKTMKDTNLPKTKVFVVHGHNGEIKESVARLIEKQGIQAIILHEQANQGATIIEKFEKNSDVGGAVCLFSADDLGRAKKDSEDKLRARQNVVFEAGYFIGKLGRKNVILIADKGVEIPSDLQGVVYTESNNWQFSVLKELKAIGYSIDYNKLD